MAIAEPYPPQTVEDLFSAYRPLVWRRCRDMLRNDSDADDAVQEVFGRAARYPGTIANPASWLLRVAGNVCMDEFRRRRKDHNVFEAALVGPRTGAGVVNPEETVVNSISAPALLLGLSEREKVVVMHRLHDLTDEESARRMGVTASTVRNTLVRARRKISAELGHPSRVAVLITTALAAARARLLGRRPGAQTANWTVAMMAPVSAVAISMLLGGGAPASGGAPAAPRAAAGAAGVADGQGPAPTPAAMTMPGGDGPVADLASLALRPAPPASAPGRQFNPIGSLQANPDTTQYSDVQASPAYSRDHTIFAAGSTGCAHQAPCWVLFRSRDGGASWRQAGSPVQVPASYLVMPRDAYAHNRFYAYGIGGLVETLDGGQTFTPALPIPNTAYAYAAAVPAYIGFDVALSSASHLWLYQAGSAPLPSFVFERGGTAGGPAMYSIQGGVQTIMQPVQFAPNPSGLDAPGGAPVGIRGVGILRCSPACSEVYANSTWAGNLTRLVAAEDDRLVLAVNQMGLALSRDGGQSFAALRLPATSEVGDAVLVGRGANARIVLGALREGPGGGGIFLGTLDGHWTRLTPALSGYSYTVVRALTATDLIASFRTADASRFGFSCSHDGGSGWGDCRRS